MEASRTANAVQWRICGPNAGQYNALRHDRNDASRAVGYRPEAIAMRPNRLAIALSHSEKIDNEVARSVAALNSVGYTGLRGLQQGFSFSRRDLRNVGREE
jgi:hypothetical protein